MPNEIISNLKKLIAELKDELNSLQLEDLYIKYKEDYEKINRLLSEDNVEDAATYIENMVNYLENEYFQNINKLLELYESHIREIIKLGELSREIID